MVDRRALGSWIAGPRAAVDPTEESGYRGQRLGRPESGPGSVAGFGRRLVALMVDWVAATLVAKAFLTAAPYPSPALSAWTMLVFAVEVWALTSTLGASFGQAVLRLRVERAHGGRVGTGRVATRTVLLCLVIPAVVYDRDGRGLHDRVVDSVVVRLT